MSKTISCIALASSLWAGTASAGVYADELSKCLVESTSTADRSALVKWLFAAASAHPAIASLSSVTAADIESANQVTGTLFMKLLTESCRSQTQKALRFEGPTTIEVSFRVLGEVAGLELFSNPVVTNNMAGIQKFIDGKKLEELKAESPPDG